MVGLGRMKLKLPDTIVPGRSTSAQILVKHPNNSGLQVDDLTLLPVDAHYAQKINVTYGGSTVFDLVSDISLSSDPSIHFTFIPEKGGEMKVQVVDSKDMKFTQKLGHQFDPKGQSIRIELIKSIPVFQDFARYHTGPWDGPLQGQARWLKLQQFHVF